MSISLLSGICLRVQTNIQIKKNVIIDNKIIQLFLGRNRFWTVCHLMNVSKHCNCYILFFIFYVFTLDFFELSSVLFCFYWLKYSNKNICYLLWTGWNSCNDLESLVSYMSKSSFLRSLLCIQSHFGLYDPVDLFVRMSFWCVVIRLSHIMVSWWYFTWHYCK